MFLANKLNKGGSLSQTDLQFNYVTMLLHGDGTNGAQNNTFLDSSTNNFTITRNGNTTQGSFSPYGDNWSNYFDGNGDYLTAANNTALDVGTGAFTIEGWIYRDGTGDTDWRIVAGSVSNAGFFGGRGTLSLGFGRSAVAWDLESASNVYSLNTWTHVVYVRNGSGNLAIFANGTRVATTTNSNNYGLNGGLIEVGAEGANQYFGGYISNVRVVKGSAVYDPTASTLTVPTTPLTAVSGTGLLTCQSNRFKDNSTNNFTITVNGNTSVQRFNPFGASTAYSTSVIGGSGYFDGSGDYLSRTTDSEELRFGTGNYTVEGWFNFSAMSSDVLMGLVAMGDVDSSGTLPWFGFYNSGGWKLGIYQFGNIGSSSRVDFTPKFNQWYHLAFERISGTNYIYINGVQQSITNTTIHSSTNWQDSGGLRVGTIGASNYFFKGFISDVRIVKGTGVYTSNFTPNTAPLTAITNTQLLLGFKNAAIFDNAMMNDLETVGNAQISTSVKKYGTGSLSFDGNDYLLAPTTPNMNFGSGDFTIEAWVYRTTESGTNNNIFQKGITTSSNFQLNLSINPSNQLFSYYSTDGSSITAIGTTTTTIPQTTWTHVAVSRSGNTWRFFINGTLETTTTAAVTLFTGTGLVSVGANPEGNSGFYGYIDDLRITKGYARYTSTFTPPTRALSDTGPI